MKPGKPSAIEAIYQDKPASYFANARRDFAALLDTGPESAVLELGCGAGGTGRAVLAAGKAGRYVGIELNPAAASAAAAIVDEVIVGNVEELDLEPLEGSFDALIVSEVLEHLTDPWTTVTRLAACLKPGALVLASSPNVAHWRVILELLRGRFAYRETGSMDRTHLRWFTPESYRAMFEQAGIGIVSVDAVRRPGWRPALVNALTGGRSRHLFMTQIAIVGRKAAPSRAP